MEKKIEKISKQTLKLCNYLLNEKNDQYIRDYRDKIKFFIIEQKNEELIVNSKVICQYIEKNFDSLVGQNALIKMEQILKEQ